MSYTPKNWKGREVTQLCPTLCDPMDCSLPGSSVHGIFQARILEWVAIAFSKELKTSAQKKKIYIQAFTRGIFIIVKKCKKPKCLSTDEWINKMWCTHTHTHCNNPDNVQHVAELRISSNCILMWLRRLSICLQCRRHRFNPWVGKISWRRAWQPPPLFLLGESPWTEEPGGL